MAVDVIMTDKMERAIEETLGKDNLPSELREKLLPFKERTHNVKQRENLKNVRFIKFSLLREVWEFLRHCSEEPIYLHQLMEGSEIHVEPLLQVQRSPELVSRLKKLKAEQEQKAYNQMVKNVDTKWRFEARQQVQQEVQSTSKELSSVVNFLLSIIGTFVFGYFASQYAFPSIEMRIIVGIILAIIVAVAELYFMARTEI